MQQQHLQLLLDAGGGGGDQSMLGEIQNIRFFFLASAASDNAGIIVTYCNKKTLSIVIIITMIRWALWLYNVIYIYVYNNNSSWALQLQLYP